MSNDYSPLLPPVWVIVKEGRIIATHDGPCNMDGIEGVRYGPIDEILVASLTTAFHLGQDFWRLGDSDSPKQWKRAEEVRAKFEELLKAVRYE